MPSLHKDELVKLIAPIAAVIPQRTPMWQMLNIEIEGDGQTLRAFGCSAEAWAESAVDSDFVGRAVVPGAFLMTVINSMPNGLIEISINTDLILKHGATEAKIPIPREDGYSRKMVSGEVVLLSSAPASKIQSAISRAIPHVNPEYPSPIFTGILFRFQSGVLRIVGGCGSGVVETAIDVASKHSVDAVIPLASAKLVQKHLLEPASVEMEITGKTATFSAGELKISSVLFEGIYPPYEKVKTGYEKQIVRECILPTKQIASAVRRKGPFLNASGGVSLELRKGIIEISTRSDSGESRDSLPINYDGDDFQIWLKQIALLAILDQIGEPNTLARFGTRTTGVILTPQKDQNFWAITMPIQEAKLNQSVQKSKKK